jgi:3-oxoacyl-[acyl-carrier-protein] synthase I
MATSLGVNASNACAAARANISRATAVDWLDAGADRFWGPEPLVAHAVRFTDGSTGVAKILALGSLALSDLLSGAQLSRTDLTETGIFLNLSDKFYEDAHALSADADSESRSTPLRSSSWQQQTADLIPRLFRSVGLQPAPGSQRLFYGGHAGFAQALAAALQHLDRGDFSQCIVGGIDSFVEPAALEAANAQGVLKANERPVGFAPGEAAAFVLLKKAVSGSSPPRVAITATALAPSESWSRSDPPKTAVALADVLTRAVTQAGGGPESVRLLIGDLNGLEIRAMEWGFTLVHLTRRFAGRFDPRLWIAPQHFGEIGAATGPVAACMAAAALARGYADSPAVVVWLSSENGWKGAIKLERCN